MFGSHGPRHSRIATRSDSRALTLLLSGALAFGIFASPVTSAFADPGDTLPPVSTDDVSTDWVKGPYRVTLSATDAGTGVDFITYQVIEGDGNPQDDTQVYSAAAKPELKDGERVTYRAVDHAGNREKYHTSRAAKVDAILPTVTDDVPTTWRQAQIEVTLTAADGQSGLKDVTYEIVDDATQTVVTSGTYDPADKPTLSSATYLIASP